MSGLLILLAFLMTFHISNCASLLNLNSESDNTTNHEVFKRSFSFLTRLVTKYGYCADIARKGQPMPPKCLTREACGSVELTKVDIRDCSDPSKIVLTESQCLEEQNTNTGVEYKSCEQYIEPTDPNKLKDWCEKKRTAFRSKPEGKLPEKCPPVVVKELPAWCEKQKSEGEIDPNAGTNIQFIKEKCKLILKTKDTVVQETSHQSALEGDTNIRGTGYGDVSGNSAVSNSKMSVENDSSGSETETTDYV